MPTMRRALAQVRWGLGAVLACAVAAVACLVLIASARAVQPADDVTGSRVRVAHGIANAGPLDVYVDGALALIGLVYPEISGELVLTAGEHQFAVVPSGSSLDAAIASGTIALADGTRSYATLFGAVEDASVGLFVVDDRPLDEGRARFRVVSGAPDAGEIVPLFAGGDAISEPLGYGDASEYAAIDAGTYDLDLVDAATGVSILPVPQTALAEGTATDVILVGLLADASLQALVIPTNVEVARAIGRTAQIISGSCDAPGSSVAELGIVRTGEGEAVGASETMPVAQTYVLAPVPFGSLIGAPHAIAVTADDPASGEAIACGEIGGRLTDTGALVVALQTIDTGESAGVAVLAPGLVDVEATGVSVFLTTGQDAGAAATPATVSG